MCKNIKTFKRRPQKKFASKNVAASHIQNVWRNTVVSRYSEVKTKILENLKCAICMDIYRTFNRCENNHGVCESCYDNMRDSVCPLCRSITSDISETLTADVADLLKINVECETCSNKFLLKHIEEHRNWCSENIFSCPASESCTRKLKICELFEHLTHHDKNTITLNDTSSLVVTHINPCDNNILIGFKNTKHVLVFGWNSVRSDIGKPLIGMWARCYYPNKYSQVIRLKIRHYNIFGDNTLVETFYNPMVEPVFPTKESVPTLPFGIVTPTIQFKNEIYLGTLKSFKTEKEVLDIMSTYKKDVQPYEILRNNSRRKYFSMICSQRDACAMISIQISLGKEVISNVFS